MRGFLKDVLKDESGFVELRYHKKEGRNFVAEKGRIENSTTRKRTGVGVRVLHQGTWGFASSGEISKESIKNAIQVAKKNAELTASVRLEKINTLPPGNFAKGDFIGESIKEVLSKSIEEKINLVLDTSSKILSSSPKLQNVTCGYAEIYEEKAIVTTDGADSFFSLIRPEFRISAVASENGNLQTGSESVGVTGGWDCLFNKSPLEYGELASKTAIDLLNSKFPNGGKTTVILAPSIVGLLVHEAIGHTVEADFVQSGSVAAGKIGAKVGSDLVTLCDSGHSEFTSGAGGSIPVDDEGILTQNTVIIENGILKSYLHNRESAQKFGVSPTGSARSWEYSDVPLIRMRNTYMKPGNSTLDEMIAATDDGYLLEGPRNGQADSNGEFMFGVQKAYKIRNGKIAEMVKGVTLSGIAFDVMNEVDMVSKEFKWDLGSGYCGKGQPAKVDAGGPYIRTRAILGGVKD